MLNHAGLSSGKRNPPNDHLPLGTQWDEKVEVKHCVTHESVCQWTEKYQTTIAGVHEIFRETAQTLPGINRDVRPRTKTTAPYLVSARTMLPQPSEHTDEAQRAVPPLGTGYGVRTWSRDATCKIQLDRPLHLIPSHPLHPAREWAGKHTSVNPWDGTGTSKASASGAPIRRTPAGSSRVSCLTLRKSALGKLGRAEPSPPPVSWMR